MSVCPSPLPHETTCIPQNDFRKIFYFGFFLEIYLHILNLVKSGQEQRKIYGEA